MSLAVPWCSSQRPDVLSRPFYLVVLDGLRDKCCIYVQRWWVQALEILGLDVLVARSACSRSKHLTKPMLVRFFQIGAKQTRRWLCHPRRSLLASSMSEADSWLRQPVEPCAESCCVQLCRAVVTWWRETTDVVILNSPWLKRSTGRALRCIWICIHLVMWSITFQKSDAKAELRDDSWLQLELAVTLLCFVHVLCVSLWTGRDDFWTGLLLCVGLFLSFRVYNVYNALNLRSQRNDLANFIVTLCHCNVHPVAICLVFVAFTYLINSDVLSSNPSSISWRLFQKDAHILIALCCLLCAFTTDFSKRIKAVTTGMLHGTEGDPTADPVLKSPVAGRTGRTWCWLAGMHFWL